MTENINLMGLERNLRDYKTACEEWKKICDVQLHKISTLESAFSDAARDLEKYGNHITVCGSRLANIQCTCGYAAAIQKLKERLG